MPSGHPSQNDNLEAFVRRLEFYTKLLYGGEVGDVFAFSSGVTRLNLAV